MTSFQVLWYWWRKSKQTCRMEINWTPNLIVIACRNTFDFMRHLIHIVRYLNSNSFYRPWITQWNCMRPKFENLTLDSFILLKAIMACFFLYGYLETFHKVFVSSLCYALPISSIIRLGGWLNVCYIVKIKFTYEVSAVVFIALFKCQTV